MAYHPFGRHQDTRHQRFPAVPAQFVFEVSAVEMRGGGRQTQTDTDKQARTYRETVDIPLCLMEVQQGLVAELLGAMLCMCHSAGLGYKGPQAHNSGAQNKKGEAVSVHRWKRPSTHTHTLTHSHSYVSASTSRSKSLWFSRSSRSLKNCSI